MSLTLSKILNKPDSTLVGVGNQAMVINRTHPEKSIRDKTLELNSLFKKSDRELSQAQKQVLDDLKARDRDVRLHEQKHMKAAGSLAKGAPQFEYEIGPDGKPYAVGGRVRIDTSPVPGGEMANRARARHIQNAAMAPGDPSFVDQIVANKSSQSILEYTASKNYNQNANYSDYLSPAHFGRPLRMYA